MQTELVTWRPLFEFGMIAFVLGVIGVASRRTLSTWLVSQGLLLLGAVLGLTAFSAVHHRPEGHTLAMWVIAAWAVQLVVGVRWLIGRWFVPVRDGEPADPLSPVSVERENSLRRATSSNDCGTERTTDPAHGETFFERLQSGGGE